MFWEEGLHPPHPCCVIELNNTDGMSLFYKSYIRVVLRVVIVRIDNLIAHYNISV